MKINFLAVILAFCVGFGFNLLWQADNVKQKQCFTEPKIEPLALPKQISKLKCSPCVPKYSGSNDSDCPCVWNNRISSFETEYLEGFARTHNLKQASGLINGTVLEPGEKFSFNEVVGKRSPDNGFKKATVIFDGLLIDDWGGGVCQVSSTLHAAILKANIKPIERRPHSRALPYIEDGLDAAVSWPEACWDTNKSKCPIIDFKFKNTYSFPIGLKTWVDEADKKVISEVYSNENVDLDVKFVTKFVRKGRAEISERKLPWIKKKKLVQTGEPGKSVTTKVIVYNKITGRKISHTFYSKYKPVPEVWHLPRSTNEKDK